jgi:SAM-dependent methyltransferase
MTATTTEDAHPATIDPAAVEAFAGRVLGVITSGMLSHLIDIGHRTELFDAAAEGPGSSETIAARAGLSERHVREWLGAMVTAGFVDYDPTTRTYALPPERAVLLTARSPMTMAPFSQLNTHLAKHVAEVATSFREGGGVPYAAYRPEFTEVMDHMGRGAFDGLLVDAVVPLVPGLVDQLTAGARVADVACGTGHAIVLLGRAFPASTFVGYDLDPGAIERARAEAASFGLDNVSFEVGDAARLRPSTPFDAVFVFDAIHDQADPYRVLARINEMLVDGGTFVMKEPRVSSNLEDNIGNPFAPLVYAVSTLHCMQVSLAEGGAALGTAFGEQLALQLLDDAGFDDVVVHDAPGDPIDAIYVSRKRRPSSTS